MRQPRRRAIVREGASASCTNEPKIPAHASVQSAHGIEKFLFEGDEFVCLAFWFSFALLAIKKKRKQYANIANTYPLRCKMIQSLTSCPHMGQTDGVEAKKEVP